MSDKKKILFVATEFGAGMLPFAATIINTIAKSGAFDVKCLCVCTGKSTYRGRIDADVDCEFIDYPKHKIVKLLYKFWPRSIIRAIERIKKQWHPDAVHFLTDEFTLGYYVKLKPDSRYCYTVHDLHPHEVESQGFVGNVLQKHIDNGVRRMLYAIDNLTTSSATQYEELCAQFPNKKVTFSHFPTLMNTEIERGGERVSELEGVTRPYILFFGSVSLYKGVDTLFEAYNKSGLADKMPLVIAGSAKGESDDKYSAPGVIRINRFIDDNEVRDLFENAAFVVYPYLSATMSGVLSLAFYFNKRVLLTNVPFFKVYDCSLTTFVDPGNVEQLQQGLMTMVTSVDEPTRANAEDKDIYDWFYSSQVLVQDYVELYSNLALSDDTTKDQPRTRHAQYIQLQP